MDVSKIVVFRTSDEEYGIPIEHVISIEKLEDINVIPNMPVYMKGVVKVRGELIPVLDTNQIFYHQNITIDNNVKLIVIQSDDISAALIVNEAKEIIDIEENQLKTIPIGAFQSTKYFSGVASIEWRLITLINPTYLIESLENFAIVKEEMMSRP
ncbi:chemotaxis protein CheW [Bacillus sp. UMB0899]|uniref:chemotaxis protein CheW n=1 Tax=Metabacillus schmidteae TaxID=2730405 RepID=UPI000C80413C|nr:chemotaxis protein CheW [Metabacillus schmidteae]PMC39520.1 chemotaxis protein CheW [Bacillus sp. UMB0899]